MNSGSFEQITTSRLIEKTGELNKIGSLRIAQRSQLDKIVEKLEESTEAEKRSKPNWSSTSPHSNRNVPPWSIA